MNKLIFASLLSVGAILAAQAPAAQTPASPKTTSKAKTSKKHHSKKATPVSSNSVKPAAK